jgi:hypothetical protein
MKPPDAALQLDDILSLLQFYSHATLGPILPAREGNEAAVMLEKAVDVVERAIQVVRWPSWRHVFTEFTKSI